MATVVIAVAGILAQVTTSIERDFERFSEQTLEVIRFIDAARFAGLRVISSTNEFVLISTLSEENDATDANEDSKAQETSEIEWAAKSFAQVTSRFGRFVETHSLNDAEFVRAIKEKGGKVITGSRALARLAENKTAASEILEEKELFEEAEQAFLDVVQVALAHEHEEFAEVKAEMEETLGIIEIVVWIGLIGIAAFVVIFGAIITRKITIPIQNLAEATSAVAAGNLSTRVEPRGDDEIATLAKSFNEMASALEQNEEIREQTTAQLVQADKLSTLGRLAAGITHELAQPLNIIRLATQTSQMDLDDSAVPSTADQTELLTTIERQVIRMADIIDHMRVFARKDKAGDETFSPVHAVENTLVLVERQFASTGIELETEISNSCGLVRGSPMQLEQVVLNFLSNAGDAIALHAKTGNPGNPDFIGRIKVALEDEPASKSVRISVTDNGGGIAEEIRANLFDPFFTTKEVGQGTGLGLSISYAIVESMGGSIQVNNTDDGATFEASLPHV